MEKRTDRWSQAARDRFTTPALMLAHLQTSPTVWARFIEAQRCRRIAVQPEGRFGLTAEECAPVQAYLRGEIDRLWTIIEPVAEAYKAHRAASIARGEASDQRPPFDDLGLGLPGHRIPHVRNPANGVPREYRGDDGRWYFYVGV